jgi:hypothetical protein
MTVATTELDVVELYDLESERVCCPYDRPCDRPATWLATKKCCGLELPFCDLHRVEALEWIARNAFAQDAWGAPTVCYVCGDERYWDVSYVWWTRIK